MVKKCLFLSLGANVSRWYYYTKAKYHFHYSYWSNIEGQLSIIYRRIEMSLSAMLLFAGTVASSLWATMRVRQVFGRFSQLPASSGLSGAETAATILRQEGIYMSRSWNTTRCSEITMTRRTSGLCYPAKFSRNVGSSLRRCGTRVWSCHTTQASLCAVTMADGLSGSDNVCQSDHPMVAVAGDVHRFP